MGNPYIHTPLAQIPPPPPTPTAPSPPQPLGWVGGGYLSQRYMDIWITHGYAGIILTGGPCIHIPLAQIPPPPPPQRPHPPPKSLGWVGWGYLSQRYMDTWTTRKYYTPISNSPTPPRKVATIKCIRPYVDDFLHHFAGEESRALLQQYKYYVTNAGNLLCPKTFRK